MDTCPKCGYARQPKDVEPFLECPRCGIVFAKYAHYHPVPAAEPAKDAVDVDEVTADSSEVPWYLRLKDRLMELPEQPNKVTLMGEALVLAVMVAWGVRLISYKVMTAEVMSSFLHDVDLPIHEFGHVLFSLFGQWMMYLGGSLFQCLLPFLIGVAFIWKQRNPFGAAFCLWWTGENVVDVAPYIYDAKLMALPLVGEWNDEVAEMHVLRNDWHNILEPLGLVDAAPAIGTGAHALGAVLMALACLWGGRWLWLAWKEAQAQQAF